MYQSEILENFCNVILRGAFEYLKRPFSFYLAFFQRRMNVGIELNSKTTKIVLN